MLAQRIALQVSHDEPLRDDVKGFIVPRMGCNNPVRQVTVIPDSAWGNSGDSILITYALLSIGIK
jgi:hypothetical protein